MIVKQLDIYKEAIRVLERAEVNTDKLGYAYWVDETYIFGALCILICDLSGSSSRVITQEVITRFKRDSEVVLGKELDEDDLWFTCINDCEPKARAERIEHLKNLIKLYEDGK